ncbi:MAG: alpha/beta fold hydrolase, partial [Alcanivoracaceae bacterium]|nr:alpha/beta fold hydrolase [Alcanivoracaceae bacterium]
MQIQKYTINTELTLRCNELKLHHGGVAHDVCLGYSVTGDLSLPLIIVLGGLSANHIVTTNQEQQGWWDDVVGCDKTIDTDKFCVISLDYFTGVVSNKDNKHTLISSYDQARLVQQLLCQLKISDVYAIIGSSYGGMVALAFAELFPHLLGKLIC